MLCDMRLMHKYGRSYENRKRVVWYAACSTACADMVEGMKIGGRALFVHGMYTYMYANYQWPVGRAEADCALHCTGGLKYALNFISGVGVLYDVGLQEASCIMQRSKVSKSLLLCYCSKASPCRSMVGEC